MSAPRTIIQHAGGLALAVLVHLASSSPAYADASSVAVKVYFPKGAPETVEVGEARTDGSFEMSADGPLPSSGATLVFPQLRSVSVRMWVPRKASRLDKCSSAPKDPEGIIFEDFSSQADSNPTIRLPELQYHVSYCFLVRGVDAQQRSYAGYFFSREPLPVAKQGTWWTDRYVLPSVGIGLTGWQALSRPSGVNAVAKPYIFVGVHITPYPTDRRFITSERVHRGWTEWLHFEVGLALTDPFQDVVLTAPLGKGLVLGGGLSFGDNILGVSAGAVISQMKYRELDQSGISHDRDHVLVAPTLNVTTQYDIVGALVKLVGGNTL